MSRVASARREQLIDSMYTRIDRLTNRCSKGTAPPMTEVWREFVAIRGCSSQAVALSEPGERGAVSPVRAQWGSNGAWCFLSLSFVRQAGGPFCTSLRATKVHESSRHCD